MAWCLTAPTHYLNQCWLIIKGVLWHSPESNFTGNAQDINSWNEFEFTISKLFPHFPGADELNDKLQCLLQLFWCWGLLLKYCDKNNSFWLLLMNWYWQAVRSYILLYIFIGIFLKEDIPVLIWISLKFVLNNPIDMKSALMLVMAWCRIVVIYFRYMFRGIFLNESIHVLKFTPLDRMAALVQVMAWCWLGVKPLPEPVVSKITDPKWYHNGPQWVKPL